jgi:chromosome segregation protein
MHLKTLRMRGFKSFAHGVELTFEHGIAVVVGPNGSGKSNIADALQWAMAVQSPAQLRAPSGLDVLFGGTDSRPPAGVCEVELVLDNECATLPIEFGEVSIMRRLSRDGDSEYFINRSRVRRLDVLELLSDTGLGREMHSVIGQGRVEEILLAKPHERRRFVEEAAGLGKYQRRRSRAESKLTRVEGELERARDLEREVRARLRPLAMQATAADRAAKLGTEIAAGRISLLSSELLGERERSTDLRARLETQTSSRDTIDAEVAKIGERRATAERELAGLASAQERAARAFYAFETSRERLSAQRARADRTVGELERAEARRRVDAEADGREAERLAAEAEAADAAAHQHVAEVAALEASDQGGLGDAAAAAEAALAAALDARRGHAEAQGQAANLRRDVETGIELRSRLAELGGTSDGSRGELETAEAEVTALDARIAEAADQLAAATTAAAEHEQAAAAAREADREAREASAAATERLAALAARLETLDAAIERGDGLPPAARALRDRGARLLVTGIEAAPGYERAVAAALGWRAGAVVTEKLEDALDMVRDAGGELTVVTGRAARGDGRAPAGGRPLSEVATLRDPSLAWAIEGVWLVDDLAGVEHGVAVTADGAGIDADRGELWRIPDAGEAAWLSARAERDRLTGEHGSLERASADAVERAARAAATLEEAVGAELAARSRLHETRAAEAEVAQSRRRAADRRDRLADELARSDAARDLAERDLETETARLAELQAVSAGYEASLTERREAAQTADERHASLEAARRQLAEEAARLGARIAAANERIERFTREAERAREGTARALASAERAHGAAVAAAAAVPAIRAMMAELETCLNAAERLAEPARSGIQEIEARATQLATELQSCATAEAQAQARAREVSSAVTEVEVALARGAERSEELTRRRAELADRFEVEWEEPAEPLLPDEAAALAARLERLERRRESLGAVNPLAAEEYEQEKVRADDLSAQCDDLETSLAELRGLIRDLTATIDERFAATFESVAHHFSEVIGTLFPGGSGRLRLTERDVVSAAKPAEEGDEGAEEVVEEGDIEQGVELEVRPAGKRIESLSLLSGGEKSLTAIAFLFALMLTKPSPFYLLDEVEAALDDANIDRFLDLLRAYQDKAQFVVITHQRRTMEVADVLYGVTMAGDGESKVLSRRMPSDPALHEAALETA